MGIIVKKTIVDNTNFMYSFSLFNFPSGGTFMACFARIFVLTLLAFSLTQGKAFGTDFCCQTMPIAGEVSIAFDDFRGIPDGTWNGNTGGIIGANIGMSVMDLFGVQAGGSYGVYDWYGRGEVASGISNGVQQQGFVTAGVFTRAQELCGFQAAAVVDWMFNDNFGVFALSPSLGQLRLHLGYLLNDSDEIGLWGTCNLNTVHERAFGIPVTFRAISQVSLFWRHIFENCAEAEVWVGLPCEKSLMFHGKRAGQYILGACFSAPVTSQLSVKGYGSYMGPTGNSVSRRFQNYNANVAIGLSYAFGMGCDNNCEAWMARPFLPVANNSSFFVDTSLNN